jgi:hypothetical protein
VRCVCCGRLLHTPKSQRREVGPVCLNKRTVVLHGKTLAKLLKAAGY